MQEFYYTYIPESDSFALDGYKGDEAEVVIPTTQSSMPVTMVFDRHTEIAFVKFPDAVFYMGSYVFDGYTNLRHIDLPIGLETIFAYAFARCGVEEVVLP